MRLGENVSLAPESRPSATSNHSSLQVFDLVLEKNLETESLHGEVHLDEAAMAQILIYPNAIIGLSDGGAHVQLQGGFGFSTRLLAEFDPDTVRLLPLEVVHDFPTGAKRIKEPAQGVHMTIVNGQVLMEDGKHSGNLPGRVLRNSYYKAQHA